MKKTVLRTANTQSVNNLTDYLNTTTRFTGLNDSTNFTSVDQNSFSDCDNVFVNADDELSTRPPVVIQDFDAGTIKDIQIANNQTFYITDTGIHWKYNQKWWQFPAIDSDDYDTILSLIIDASTSRIFSFDTYYLIFIEKNSVVSLYGIKYSYDDDNFEVYDAHDLLYIPNTEIHYGNTTNLEAESANLLTPAHRVQYIFSLGITTPSSSLNGFEVEVCVGDDTYNLVWDESLVWKIVKKIGVIKNSEESVSPSTCVVNDQGIFFATLKNDTGSAETLLYSLDGDIWYTIIMPRQCTDGYKIATISENGGTVWLYEYTFTDDDSKKPSGTTTSAAYDHLTTTKLFYGTISLSDPGPDLTWYTIELSLTGTGHVAARHMTTPDSNEIKYTGRVSSVCPYRVTASTATTSSHLMDIHSAEDGECILVFVENVAYRVNNNLLGAPSEVSSVSYAYDLPEYAVGDDYASEEYQQLCIVYVNDYILQDYGHFHCSMTEAIGNSINTLNAVERTIVRYQPTSSTPDAITLSFLFYDQQTTSETYGHLLLSTSLIFVDYNNLRLYYNYTPVVHYSTIYGITESMMKNCIQDLPSIYNDDEYDFTGWDGPTALRYDLGTDENFHSVLFDTPNSLQIKSSLVEGQLHITFTLSRYVDELITEDVIFDYYCSYSISSSYVYSDVVADHGVITLYPADQQQEWWEVKWWMYWSFATLSDYEKNLELNLQQYNNGLSYVCSDKVLQVTDYTKDGISVMFNTYYYTDGYTDTYWLHNNVIPLALSSSKYFYYRVGTDIYSNYFSGEWYVYCSFEEFETNLIMPTFLDDFITYSFIFDNLLYQTQIEDGEDGNGILYVPENSKVEFPDTITNTVIFSQTVLAVFTEHTAYEYTYDNDNDVYRLYPTKLQLGNREGYEICTAFDGLTIYMSTVFGYKSLTYESFVQSTEQAFTDCCAAINSIFDSYDDAPIKQAQYNYWIFLYKQTSNQMLVYDTRYDDTDYDNIRYPAWFKWTLPYNINKIWYEGRTFYLWLSDNNIYTMEFTDTSIYDITAISKQPITWLVRSQKLHFSYPAYYKHVSMLTSITLQNDIKLRYNLKFYNYRNAYDTEHVDTVEYPIETLGICNKRVNFMKTNAFQYEISNDDTDKYPSRFVLSSIVIKFRVTEKIR